MYDSPKYMIRSNKIVKSSYLHFVDIRITSILERSIKLVGSIS